MNWGQRSLSEQIGDWCRHFNGVQNDACKASVRYKDLPQDDKKPCFKSDNCADRCSHASYLSDNEIAVKVQEHEAAVKQYLDRLHDGKCPVCGAEVQEEKQVGRSVYALPCWHRMYQGQAKKKPLQGGA